jgi:hypothetical protein
MRRVAKTAVGVAAAVALAATAAVSISAAPLEPATAAIGSCPLPTFGAGSSYRPQLDRAAFSPNVTNPYFPLTPGTTFVYRGTKDGKQALDLVVPTTRTKVIDGVPTRVVEDRLYLNGALEERTSDYYSQDRCGNVWYFGEDTAELDAHGKVRSTNGSFHAGVNGGQPGVYMAATPAPGRWFRQEWSHGQAEDRFKVISTSSPVTAASGKYRAALRTEERTALERGVVDNKYYVRGIGQVAELSVKGPTEKLTLVEVIS